MSRPPEETQHPSVLAHANDPAKSRIRDRDPLKLSPPRGNHPRSSACAPKDNREGRQTASQKREKKMSARHAEPRCLGPKPRLCGWKKSRPGRMCRSWGPKNLRRQSEIRTGSLALTARVRSGRDHPDREHVDHQNGSKHPEEGSGVLFISMPSPRRPLPCLG